MLRRLALVIRHSWHLWRVLSSPKNAAKGDWGNESPNRLLFLAQRELAELSAAVWAHTETGDLEDHVALEAADVSACCAMLADLCRRRGKSAERAGGHF